MHNYELIIMLASALAAALGLGWLTLKFGLSPIVGYLLAGIFVGPYTPGFVADVNMAGQLAEIGVILLMFSVGLHFRPQELVRVWRIAVPGAIGQSFVATLFGLGIALFFGWDFAQGLIVGMGLAVASTVVLMRMLSEQGRLSSIEGHIAVGWLIVEDIITVIMLVILPALKFENNFSITQSVIFAFLKVALFSFLFLLLGPRLISPLLEKMAKTRSAELFTLSIFVLAISVAAIAAHIFHVSVALGAFVGGLVVGQSRIGDQAGADILPFKDVFSALFFVSVGMLFSPEFVLQNPGLTLAALGVVLIVKPLVAVILVFVLNGSLATALIVSIGLAQIGEFSFILATLSRSLDLLSKDGYDLLVTCSIFSIALNPILFRIVPILEEKAIALYSKGVIQKLEISKHKTQDQFFRGSVIVAGYGEIGKSIAQKLEVFYDKVFIVDNNLEKVENASHSGYKTCFGNAQHENILIAAGIHNSNFIFVAISDILEKMHVCQTAKKLNNKIMIIVLCRSEQERAQLEEAGIDYIITLSELIQKELVEILGM